MSICFLLALLLVFTGCSNTPQKNKIVEFHTSEGLIEITLDQRSAPKTCEQFLRWCEGIEMPGTNYKDSLYLGNNFYHVEPNIFIQSGDVFNQGKGAEIFEIDYERTSTPATIGSVFLVKDMNTNKNNSIFAILLIDNPKITDVYTIFGKVTGGLDICYKISNTETTINEELGIKSPVNDIKINRVLIKED
jgi:cyclophilin family peptidyl-prolyl cis-trans isomerase